jgi:hypothetical protein
MFCSVQRGKSMKRDGMKMMRTRKRRCDDNIEEKGGQ